MNPAPVERFDRTVRVPETLRKYRIEWPWIPALVCVALVLAALALWRSTPVYRASTSLIIVPSDQVSETADVIRAVENLERRGVVATIARLPGSDGVRQAAADAMGVAAADLRAYRVSGVVVPNTSVVRVDVDGPDARRVAQVADAVGGITASSARELFRVYGLRALSRATIPDEPVSPRRGEVLGLAALAGLVLGVAAAVGVPRLTGKAR